MRDQSKVTADVWYHNEDLPYVLGSLRARLNDLEAQLVRFQALQQDVQREREKLERTIWAIEVYVGDQESAAVPDGTPIWQHIRNLFLSKGNNPMNISEIMAGLDAKGVRLDPKSSDEIGRAILIRKLDIFKRLDGGKFRIK